MRPNFTTPKDEKVTLSGTCSIRCEIRSIRSTTQSAPTRLISNGHGNSPTWQTPPLEYETKDDYAIYFVRSLQPATRVKQCNPIHLEPELFSGDVLAFGEDCQFDSR